MFSTVVLEKTLESPLDYKAIKPVNPKGYQHWIFIGRNAEAEASIFWPPHAKTRLIGKDSDAGKDKSQKMGIAEDEMVVWHLSLNGHEFEQAPGVGEVQGSLKCCSPWGCRVGHNWVTEQQHINIYCIWYVLYIIYAYINKYTHSSLFISTNT